MKIRYILVLLVSAFCVCGQAQEEKDAYLKKLRMDLVNLRSEKVTQSALSNNWSAAGSQKLTLMDDIRFDREAEYRGSDANKFRANQLVASVYTSQNMKMVSKGNFLNSTEKDVYYSAVEKTIKKNRTARYSLTGHIGHQEFVFVSFNPKSKFAVTVDGKEAREIEPGVKYVDIGSVNKEKVIVITLTNYSSRNESFVILNHNPQR